MRNAVWLLVFVLVANLAYADDCAPIMLNLSDQVLTIGQLFSYNISAENASHYSFLFLGPAMPAFRVMNDTIAFTPMAGDLGVYNALIVASDDNYCYSTQLVQFRVYDMPSITRKWPDTPLVNSIEDKNISFGVEVKDNDANDSFTYEWVLDSRLSSNETNFTHHFDYNSSGIHNLVVTITDMHNLSDTADWNISVANFNRPPQLTENITDLSWYENHNNSPFSLSSYFADPDGDKLKFTPRYMSDYAVNDIETRIDSSGRVTFIPRQDFKGTVRIKVIAMDPAGLQAESNIITLETLKYAIVCGDGICYEETCNTCPQDCGICGEDCKEDWICKDWLPCTEGQVQTRECTDKNLCHTEASKPITARPCTYSCSDGIQNQGETGVDCGGTCKPCTTCNNRMLDGSESDIDCGGTCKPCQAGKKCNKELDCNSFVCLNSLCQSANCSDLTRNQDERGTDCGGVCFKPCPSCEDGMKNGDETGVDCGGHCAPCPSCSDGIRNGDEKYADCGGSCRQCNIFEHIRNNTQFFAKWLIVVVAGAAIFLTIVLIIKNIFLDVKSHKKLNALLLANSLTGYASKKVKWSKRKIVEKALERLVEAEKSPGTAEEFTNKTFEILKETYSSLFALPSEFKPERLHFEIKNAKELPKIVRSMLLTLYSRMEELMSRDYVYAVQAERLLKDAKAVLKVLKGIMKD